MKTRAERLEKYGSDYFIEKKIEEGELFKVGKGIYSEKKYVPEIAMFVYKYPNAVVTMKSAFFFHGLTAVIPDECDLARTRDAAKIKDERVKQYFVPDDFFEEGIETADYKGYDIRIYNKERMLIELVRYKSKFYSWRYSNGGMADVFIWKKINYYVHTRWEHTLPSL